VLTAYGCALFRATLLGHNTALYLSGDVLPAGIMTQHIFRAFERSKALTVDDFDDGNTISTNSLNQPTRSPVASQQTNSRSIARRPLPSTHLFTGSQPAWW
jgi:hypothetical protein